MAAEGGKHRMNECGTYTKLVVIYVGIEHVSHHMFKYKHLRRYWCICLSLHDRHATTQKQHAKQCTKCIAVDSKLKKLNASNIYIRCKKRSRANKPA